MLQQPLNRRFWPGVLLVLVSSLCQADSWEQAKRMHDRLAGVPASEAVLKEMKGLIEQNQATEAAYKAMDNDAFYRVTLKNWVAPWTNREQNQFIPLNDYIATVMGYALDGRDFRGILSDDWVYVGQGVTPAYALNNNAHYEALENSSLSLKTALTPVSQSSLTGYAGAAAGVMTSRAAAKSFFIAGTNRAMLRFTLMNHLCHDLEQLHDVTRVPDRIRQDVSRSPGGDARLFLTGCMGCHNGMDPLAQAFAYYNYEYDADTDTTGENGRIRYNADGVADPKTKTRVVAKYHINNTTFPYGYVTTDDTWDNYWREGQNASLGWASGGGHGQGASALGRELANSEAFSQCQAKKVFKQVCLRPPESGKDFTALSDMVASFKAQNGQLKTLFAAAAVYCGGAQP
ncbi:MAG: hypothetical protein RL497_216 [Pseudomonadota bacterium]|jgi:hypothetical protein